VALVAVREDVADQRVFFLDRLLDVRGREVLATCGDDQ
jgi:hypothetical protein